MGLWPWNTEIRYKSLFVTSVSSEWGPIGSCSTIRTTTYDMSTQRAHRVSRARVLLNWRMALNVLAFPLVFSVLIFIPCGMGLIQNESAPHGVLLIQVLVFLFLITHLVCMTLLSPLTYYFGRESYLRFIACRDRGLSKDPGNKLTIVFEKNWDAFVAKLH